MPIPYPISAVRGPLVHFVGNPFKVSTREASEYFPDGLLITQDGKVVEAGPAERLLPKYPGIKIAAHFAEQHLILPGFIDAHLHYPQTEIVGAYGEQLLDWLDRYAFPAELKFADQAYATEAAEFFLQQLLAHGTTTAAVFATSHPNSAEALFIAAEQRHLRMITGKVLMDRNAPTSLRDNPQSGYEDSKTLIEKWHRKPGTRLEYAITPRFAPACSPEQLALAGRLKKEFPDTYVQTHISENHREVAWVADLFPQAKDYLDVYDQHGLLSDKTILAHCIHLSDRELSRMADAGCTAAFCPTSNLFLGSGLFNLHRVTDRNVGVAIGTDIGAGTSFSMLQTLNEAYKIAQLQQQRLSAYQALYLATLGGAKALRLDPLLGNFLPGKEADFVVLDLHCTPFLQRRMSTAISLEEKLFVLMTLGDDRAIDATYILGKLAYQKHGESSCE